MFIDFSVFGRKILDGSKPFSQFQEFNVRLFVSPVVLMSFLNTCTKDPTAFFGTVRLYFERVLIL